MRCKPRQFDYDGPAGPSRGGLCLKKPLRSCCGEPPARRLAVTRSPGTYMCLGQTGIFAVGAVGSEATDFPLNSREDAGLLEAVHR